MTTNIIILTATLLSSLLAIFALNYFINSRVKGKLSEIETPITIDIMKVVLFICSSMLLAEMTTTFQTLVKVLPSSFAGNDLLIQELFYFTKFVGIVLISFIVIVWLSILMFSMVQKGKSIFIETVNNNTSAVILFSGIVIALSIVTKTGLTPLLDQFIPYPTLPMYH